MYTYLIAATILTQTYSIVDTGQTLCFDNTQEISAPSEGDTFWGQDGSYEGVQSSYQDNGDGTITDLNTGLIWQKSPDFTSQYTHDEAVTYANNLYLAGQNDWRLPTIKELYSIVLFIGQSSDIPENGIPYLDDNYFDYENVTEKFGNRPIDMQFWSSTIYVGGTMNGDATAFGMNFADGRIKGYPMEELQGGGIFSRYVRCVRGDTDYGTNELQDNGDGTVTDNATGLQWMQGDSVKAMNWESALNYCNVLEFGDHSDWRLPNAKELHSIVDYTRAPLANDPSMRSAAIDPIFEVTTDESYFWTSTTFTEVPPGQGAGPSAVYICFGRSMGYMCPPWDTPPCDENGNWLDVHGAGAQRSDPKLGDPNDYPYGHGPQGDDVRIYNYVRAVRDVAGCIADLDGNGYVGVGDILALIDQWGVCNQCPADFDNSGSVDVVDLLEIVNMWGSCE